ncbi:MAG: transposase family protein [Gammaproteobacteria bacterium]|nr:transposase family protein [Gammaproteobacteria bacterium]
MARLFQFFLTLVTTSVRSRLSLQAENAALRNQLSLYQKSRKRPRIRPTDRLLWCLLAKFWTGWRAALYFVQPRTVTTWQKKRFRDYWCALSKSAKPGRPRISRELRMLIVQMWETNPTWGSPKIVAEFAMLGIEVAKSTVEKYQPTRPRPSSPTWRTFLDQHVRNLVSIDFFIVPTATFRVLFVFIVLAHDRRRIVHFNVTEHPTAQWTAQQIVEAFPFDTAPSYLIRDGDGIYGERVTRRIESLGIDEVITAPASPWQNAYVERVIGTLRRELFDHVIVFNERHLKRRLSSYLEYYHPWRTHQSLNSDAPDGRPVRAAESCNVVELPAVHGLHHVYLPKVA